MTESDDLRTFIREITLRFERGIERISRDIRADVAVQREENRRYFEVLDARTREMLAESRELLEETRAHRSAFLAILDRLDNGGTAPAAG